MNSKQFFKNITTSVERKWVYFVYCMQLLVYEDFHNYVKKEKRDKSLIVLANGPSLKDSLNGILTRKEYEIKDVVAVNFMINDGCFYEMKPKYIVISDPSLFRASIGYEEKVNMFFSNLNKRVDWNLTLFMTFCLWKDKEFLKRVNNPLITVIPLHGVTAPEDKKSALKLYRKGLLAAEYGSVLHHAILAGMQMGYQCIEVYGADHTFFDGLCVDEQNRVCRRVTHFYDADTKIQPITHIYTGKRVPYTMSFFLWEYGRVFLGHDIIRYIADNMSIKIINKTPNSMIDSYMRES